MLHFWRRQRLY